MREIFENILAVYGQAVSSAESGESWRAFVQPVRTERSEEERQATALGDVDQRRWLYIGPGDRELRREEVILCGGTAYRVRESVTVPFGEERLYCRGILRLEKERAV